MNYVKKDYSRLVGLQKISEKTLENHFALYEGYVNNVNKISDELSVMNRDQKQETVYFAELKRRIGWEWNGMRLHELYFSNLGGDGKIDESSQIFSMIVKNFGGFSNWKKDFVFTGKMRGIGWVVLFQDGENLFNSWINEHDTGHLSGAKPLLIMDVFEHAYFLDYGKDKASYIEAFMENVDWKEVEKRIS